MKCALTSSLARYPAAAIAVLSAVMLTTATAGGQTLPAPVTGVELGVMLQAVVNGLCVDNAGSGKPGTAMQGWKCSPRNLNQRFKRVDRGKDVAALKNKLSGLCLDAGNGAKKAGDPVFQAPCAKRASQTLNFLPLSGTGNNTHFQIRAGHSGLCLQLAGNTKRGGRLTQARCDKKNANQKFSFRN